MGLLRHATLPALLGGASGLSLVQKRAGVPLVCAGEMMGHISESTVVMNNLGGMGPTLTDSHFIAYKNVGTCDGMSIDMKVSATTAYTPENAGAAATNGKDGNSGKFGFLNMACGTDTDLKFEFSTDDTPVTLGTSYFSFHDLDSGNKEIVREWMGVYSVFDEAFLANSTELVEETMGPSGTRWRSSTPGSGRDNPDDPLYLTDQQKDRSVTIKMLGASYIDTNFGVTSKAGCKGRNFIFSFKTSLVPPPPTPSPTTAGETCSTCVIWGDPHVITFQNHEARLRAHPSREEFFRTRGWKSDQVTVNEGGYYWLVKGQDLGIQGTYVKNHETNTTSLHSIAVSGSFIDNKLLIIRALGEKTTWDGKEILSSVSTAFKNDLVDAKYHKDGRMVKDGTHGPSMDFVLPSGVSLTVNRWKESLAVEIEMCGRADAPQDGQCGILPSSRF
jgi:hypothetical protein